MTTKAQRLAQAQSVLLDLGLPKAQINERSALCLLALLNLSAEKPWEQAQSPLIGITPIMAWAKEKFKKDYAPNTRETFRRQSMHQFIEAGICTYNPDDPGRAVNSPWAVYQIEPNLLPVLKAFDTTGYKSSLANYLKTRKTLVEKYANARVMHMVPVQLSNRQQLLLSPGEHSALIKNIIEDFGARFAPGGELVYAGDTGNKQGFFNEALLSSLGVQLDNHGKLPDVVIFLPDKNWLLLIESVTSHGPVDGKRLVELAAVFKGCTAGLVYVSAFPSRKVFLKYLEAIAWESEVWIADAPSHLIHFNGVRFLGPYEK